MPPFALGLVLSAAVLHASYHLLYKKSLDKEAFSWWLLCVSTVAYFPLFLAYQPSIPADGWPLILASGAGETMYFALLARAYDLGDLSLVYPLARGSAPLFIFLLAFSMLGERVAALGMLGIGLVAVGLYLLPLRSLDDIILPLRALRDRPARLALLAGMAISAYTVTDKVGVRLVDPFPYIYLVLAVTLGFFTMYLLVTHRIGPLPREWRANKVSVSLSGILGLFTYLLVLKAMQMSYVSYVGSVREVSIVLGALIGWLVLKEECGPLRLTASALVFAGTLLIGASR